MVWTCGTRTSWWWGTDVGLKTLTLTQTRRLPFFMLVLGSASQMLPEITPQVKTVTQFIRTPHWLIQRPNAPFGPWIQWAFQHVPFFATLMRFRIFAHLETSEWPLFPTNERARKMRRAMEAASRQFVKKVAPKKYHDMLIPDWEIACKVCVCVQTGPRSCD